MSWIKMRSNLDSDPDVIAIAEAVKLDEFSVIGRLWKIWNWAGEHSVNGNAIRVTTVTLNRITHCEGFAQAMKSVGWLSGEEGCLTFPKFDRHNSETAKHRALSQKRSERYRRHAPASLPLSSLILSIIYPKKTDPAFKKKFEEWMEFRRGLGKKPKDWRALFQGQLDWIERFPRNQWCEILAQSIRNGWQGLFELKSGARLEKTAATNGKRPVPADFGGWLKKKYPEARMVWKWFDDVPDYLRTEWRKEKGA